MKRIILTCCIVLLAACARLDDNLFNPSKVSSYLRDNYTGETDIKVNDPKYDIQLPATVTEIELTSFDGKENAKLAAMFIGEVSRIGEPGYQVILYCHGNRDHMDFYWPRVKLLANGGAQAVMTLDYRGYGKSQGTPSENGLYADVDAAMLWLEDAGLNSADLIMYGFSMGSAPAVELTANSRRGTLKPSKLILEAPFASAEVMIQDSSLIAMPGSYVSNLKIDNANKIKTVTLPLLWLHGTADDFLNIETHGEVVYKNHPGIEGLDKFASRVPGAGHSNIPEKLGEVPLDDYSTVITSFITP